MLKKTLFMVLLGAAIACTPACGDEKKKSSGGDKDKKSETSKTEKKEDKAKDSKKISTKMMAWALGSKLSLTALSYSRGLEKDVVGRMMKRCQIIAKALGTQVPPLFKLSGTKAKDSAAAMNYVMSTAGKKIGSHLLTKYDKAHASLFELAMKSNLLHLLYIGKKGDKTSDTIAKVIEGRAKRAGVPSNLYSDVVSKIRAGKSSPEVKGALRKMHKEIQEYLKDK